MQKCWLSNPDDRPTFSELSSTMEDTLRQTAISDHCEVKVDLTHTEDESTGIFILYIGIQDCIGVLYMVYLSVYNHNYKY